MKINSLFYGEKTLVVGKLKIVLIVAAILLTYHAQVPAQDPSAINSVVNLPSQRLALRELLHTIEEQTDFLVVYGSKEIDIEQTVNFETPTTRVTDLLSTALKDTGLSYVVDKDYIILSQESKDQPQSSTKKSIRGRVTDPQGDPLPGSLVMELGTGNAVIAADDGSFQIFLSSGRTATLEFSFLGRETVQVAVSDAMPNIGSIVLTNEDRIIDEVVIVGYGTQKKANLTGAVGSVSYDNVVSSSRPLTSTSSSLSGTVAGLNVRQSSGTPGADNASLSIRGIGSFNSSTSPLVLIDGQLGDIDQISPNDIADVTVLKDAASAAIYGSRGSNGVILITTKSGSNTNGKIDFEYNGSVGWNRATRIYDIVSNTADHMELTNKIVGGNGVYTAAQIAEWREKSKTDKLGYPNTDWWDALLNTNMIHTHQFSLRGGNDRISTYTSVNYQQNNGLMPNTSYDVWNMRSNVDLRVNDWLKFSTVLTGMIGDNDAGDIGGAFTWFYGTTPAVVPKSPDGRYGDNQTGSGSANNPLWILERMYGEKRKRRFTGKIDAVITPLKGLTINASYFQDMYHYQEDIITSDPVRWDFQRNVSTTTGSAGIIEGNNSNVDYNSFDAYATYQHTFVRDHNLKVMAGYNMEKNSARWTSIRKSDLLSLQTPVLDAASELQMGGGGKAAWSSQSFFARVNYDYRGKYLVELNWRSDWSSKLPPPRVGNFPGVSAGWRISEEEFWNGDVKRIMNYLKLRVSWGGSLGITESEIMTGNPFIMPTPGLSMRRSRFCCCSSSATTISTRKRRGSRIWASISAL